MKYVLLFLLLIPFSGCWAQHKFQFRSTEFPDTIPTEIYDALKARLVYDKAQIKEKGKVGNYIKTLYDQRFEYIVHTFNKDYILVDHPITQLLTRINQKIHAHNTYLEGGVRVYTYSSETPNAVSFGEGSICIMLGLLERLETEDEIAFVLCHELAHYYARHAENNISEMAALNYDKELKSKIDAIMKSPYERYTKLKSLFNSLDLSVTRHTRKSEFEADSLGLVYYLNTSYNPYAPLRVMQVLAAADSGLHPENLDFRKYFNATEFPFKDSWTAYKKPDLLYKPFRDGSDDTLRTHPNCQRRFVKLQRQMHIDTVDTLLLRSGTALQGENHIASMDIVNMHYHFKEYGKALFKAMLLADQFPDEPYPHAMIAKSLYQLYKAQFDHNLHSVLELPDPRFDENYNRFLTFINRLRLNELARISYEYATTRPESFYADEEFIHAFWMCSRFEFSKIDPEKVRAEYQHQFPQGKYLKEMKN